LIIRLYKMRPVCTMVPARAISLNAVAPLQKNDLKYMNTSRHLDKTYDIIITGEALPVYHSYRALQHNLILNPDPWEKRKIGEDVKSSAGTGILPWICCLWLKKRRQKLFKEIHKIRPGRWKGMRGTWYWKDLSWNDRYAASQRSYQITTENGAQIETNSFVDHVEKEWCF